MPSSFIHQLLKDVAADPALDASEGLVAVLLNMTDSAHTDLIWSLFHSMLVSGDDGPLGAGE